MAVKPRRARLQQRWTQVWYRFPMLRLVVLLVALLLLQAVLFWSCERGHNPEISSPLEALWAIAVFVFSGADFTPVTAWGRFLALVGIVEGMTLVSVLIASLTVWQLRGRKGVTRKMKGHIIIVGGPPRVRRLIQQLQSPDLKTVRPIVLVADLPQNPVPDLRVKFVSGDPAQDETLQEAGVEQAYGAIVLADLSCPEPDARTLLVALAIEHLNPEVYTVVEVVDPRNVLHFRHARVDEVICLNQFSDYLILQSMVSPGLSRMFRSLLEFGEGDEVYRVVVPSTYVGWTFRDLFLDLYQQRGMILLAVERGERTIINPKGEFRLQEGDALFLIAPEEPSSVLQEA
ncbi:MAG: NAD-binding protein [Thermoflexales bacterium]|nr:NAD-binding protein [Thermoflexales bacterium]